MPGLHPLRWPPTLQRAAAIAVGTGLALLIGEAAVRIAWHLGKVSMHTKVPATVKANAPYATLLYESHPFLPWALRPGVAVVLNPERKAPAGTRRRRWVDHRINSLGARGGEIAVPKPKGTVRIATLGGSTTFSIHTNAESSWPSVLGTLLNARSGGSPRYEVLNFGTPKATSPYSLVMLATRVIHLQPDVVVAYEAVNEVSNWRFAGLRPDHSHVFADLDEVPRWVEEVPGWAFRSALVTATVYQLALRKEEHFGERKGLKTGAFAREEGTRIFLANYRSMRGICDAHGARFVAATFHTLSENDSWGREIAALNQSLREWGAAEGVPVADPAARIPREDRSLHTDGAHLTVEGNRRVAEVIAETLQRDVLPRLAPSAAPAALR